MSRRMSELRREIDELKREAGLSHTGGFTKKEKARYTKDPVAFAREQIYFKGKLVRLSDDQSDWLQKLGTFDPQYAMDTYANESPEIQDYQFSATVASRNGGKTFIFAIYALWRAIFFDNLWIRELGGSMKQAKIFYHQYFKKFIEANEKIFIEVKGKVQSERTEFKSGSVVETGACSETSVRGPHPDILLLDEVAAADKAKKTAIIEAALDSALGQIVMACYDINTDVLTEDGWKQICDITLYDKVATLINGELVFDYPTNTYEYDYSGKMYNLHSTQIDSLVTPNHKQYIKQRGNYNNRSSGKFELINAEKTVGKIKTFKKSAIWNGMETDIFILPGIKIKMGRANYKDKNIDIDDWLKFHGLWTADGWTESSSYRIGIRCPTQLDKLYELKEILTKYNIPSIIRNGCLIICSNKQLWNYLKQFGKSHQKYIPKIIKSLTSDKLKIWLRWYIYGDGAHSRYKTECPNVAYTSSLKLKDDIQEVALKCGFNANSYERDNHVGDKKMIGNREITVRHKSWLISIRNKTNETTVDPTGWTSNKYYEKMINYNGKVYCIEVPSHIIYVRRSGKTYWSGNSTAHHVSGLFIRYLLKAEEFGYKIFKWPACDLDPITKEIIRVRAPWIPKWRIEHAMATKDWNTFSVEWLADVASTASMVFGITLVDKAIIPIDKFVELSTADNNEAVALEERIKDLPKPMQRYYLEDDDLDIDDDSGAFGGCDIGYVHPTAIVILKKDLDDCFWAVHFEHYRGRSANWRARRIAELQEEYGIDQFCIDAEDISFAHMCIEAGAVVKAIPFQTYKVALIGTLRSLFEKGLIKIPDTYTVLIDQLKEYAYDSNGKPVKGNDDAVDALLFAVFFWSANTNIQGFEAVDFNPW